MNRSLAGNGSLIAFCEERGVEGCGSRWHERGLRIFMLIVLAHGAEHFVQLPLRTMNIGNRRSRGRHYGTPKPPELRSKCDHDHIPAKAGE